MNPKVRILIILLLGVVIVIPTTIVNARATRIDFVGTELCDPATLYAESLWWAGPNLQVRGWTQTCYESADTSEMEGVTYLYDGLAVIGNNYVVNVNFLMITNEGGVWRGVCQLGANTDIIKCVGHGEGIYEGLELHSFPSPNNGEPTQFTGYVLDHSH